MTTRNEALPSPAPVVALEKIPPASRRMALSTAQFYREVKAGRIGPIVKLGERASAIPSEAVDRWIAERIATATRLADQKGGRP
jgi:predicted DNA-binding transcriptional regulator AlpA